ncbi:MAG: hypothetical protein ACREBD_09035 [Blastocatellia bacterium]
MKLKCMRFLSLLFAALALGPALAHLLELPNKINLSGADYLTAQQIHRDWHGWAILEIVVVVALFSTLFLAIVVRDQPKAFTLTLIALLCIAGTQVVSWTFTYPANQATNNWTLLPANWQELRQQWEYSHAASAVLNLIALALLILSVLVNGSSKKVMRMSAEYFPTSSKSEKAQVRFLQDVVAFHSSWYATGLDEVREVNEIEPDLFHDELPKRGMGEQLSNLSRVVGERSRMQGA